ncbi:MAG: hypothetical protein QNI92_18470, partial [Desulfobacterales bacterium]|nr:hypothetical protein [Desulfobacterales bacterium]
EHHIEVESAIVDRVNADHRHGHDQGCEQNPGNRTSFDAHELLNAPEKYRKALKGSGYQSPS